VRIVFANGRDSVPSGISKRLCRYISQEVCPWNRKFARELLDGSPFAPRSAISGRDARSLALDFLAMSPPDFTAAFKGSPMKRAKLRGLKRDASVVLGNVGTELDVPALAAALDDPEPVVRSHAAWALRRLGSAGAAETVHRRLVEEGDGRIE
jgi:epoxyqueuosine reductase